MSTRNGTSAKSPSKAEIVAARRKAALLEAQLRVSVRERQLSTFTRLRESSEMWYSLGGAGEIFDRLRTQDKDFAGGISTAMDRRYGANWPFWRTWQEHARLRFGSRLIVGSSGLASGTLNGLVSFVIGTGFTYRAVARKGMDPPKELLSVVQMISDEFDELNRWPSLEQELCTRDHRDGEFFLQHHIQDGGETLVHTIEPEWVKAPPNEDLEINSFGLFNDRHNLLDITSFWVTPDGDTSHGEEVDAGEIEHKKCNVDRIIKRGCPDFAFEVYETFKRVSRLLENMTEGAAIQAAIVAIRQHAAAPPGQVDDFLSTSSTYQQDNYATGNRENVQRYDAGTFLDIDKGQEYVQPPFGTSTQSFVEMVQAGLRAGAVKWNAPEWLTSADASNSNFASSLVAESPFARGCKREQEKYKWHFLRVRKKAIKAACDAGRVWAQDHKYSWDEVRRLIDITATAPTVEVRDRLKEAQTAQTEIMGGINSRQNAVQALGYDWEQIEKDNEEYDERHGQQGQGLPMPGQDQIGGMGAGQGGLDLGGGEGASPFESLREELLDLGGSEDENPFDLEIEDLDLLEATATRTQLQRQKFTGVVKDKRGTRHCFQQGKVVGCPGLQNAGGKNEPSTGLKSPAATGQGNKLAVPKSGNPQTPAASQAGKPGRAVGQLAHGLHPLAKQAVMKVAEGIKSNKTLTKEQRVHFFNSAQAVFKGMNETALKRYHAGLNGPIEFHADPDKLLEGMKGRFKDDPAMIGKIETITSGGKQLGGCYTVRDNAQSQRMFLDGDFARVNASAAHVYAHEFSHAIDGPTNEISRSPEWQDAFKAELANGQATKYGATQSSEGFAEIGRLMLNPKVPRAAIQKKFPKCFAVWQKHGLVSGSMESVESLLTEGDEAALEEIFSERIDLGEDGSHADVLLADQGDEEPSVQESILESALLEAGFTGTITDKLGRKVHYVDGKRVAKAPQAKEPEKPQVPATPAHSTQDKQGRTVTSEKEYTKDQAAGAPLKFNRAVSGQVIGAASRLVSKDGKERVVFPTAIGFQIVDKVPPVHRGFYYHVSPTEDGVKVRKFEDTTDRTGQSFPSPAPSTAAPSPQLSSDLLSQVSRADKYSGVSIAELHRSLEKEHPGLSVGELHGILTDLADKGTIRFHAITRIPPNDQERADREKFALPRHGENMFWVSMNRKQAWEGIETTDEAIEAAPILDAPDIRQAEGWSCGAVALLTVAKYFGVVSPDLDNEPEFIARLGSTPEGGTLPAHIVALAKELGLDVKSGPMNVEDLAEAVRAGKLTICPIQEYDDDQREEEGHYVVVIGLIPEGIVIQDPVQGRRTVDLPHWEEAWHDRDAENREYCHYGIRIGKLLIEAKDKTGHEHKGKGEGGGQFTAGSGGDGGASEPATEPQADSKKYPRTPHVPKSPGGTRDDRRLPDLKHFVGREVIITEKVDGSNVRMTRDSLTARSQSGPPRHSSFDLGKALHAGIKDRIPKGLAVFGEYVYAKHSIGYDKLPGHFLIFAAQDTDTGKWWSWDEVHMLSADLGVPTVPVLYRGTAKSEEELEALVDKLGKENSVLGPEREGAVMRLADGFDDLSKGVAKWVRAGHVQSDEHWTNQKIEKNKVLSKPLAALEACLPNKTGHGHHDDKTGYPCGTGTNAVAPDKQQAQAEVDANRPSRPENRRNIEPPKQEFVAPPAPKGTGSGKAGGFTATGETNTAIGDRIEALTEKMGMRSILPEGQRHGKDVKKFGSTLDREFDHSGWGFEVKACTTGAKEYKAKPKAAEMAGKRKFARLHKLKPATMIAVVDTEGKKAHFYWRPGIGAFGLTETNAKLWNYAGSVDL